MEFRTYGSSVAGGSRWSQNIWCIARDALQFLSLWEYSSLGLPCSEFLRKNCRPYIIHVILVQIIYCL